jgi:transposase
MDTNGRVRRKQRSWPEALKREIVAAASARGASVSAVAQQYGVNTNMVFAWRKRYGGISAGAAAPPQLVPVVVTSDQISAAPAATPPTEDIEIELPHGTRIRVGAGVNAAALRVVLDALARR